MLALIKFYFVTPNITLFSPRHTIYLFINRTLSLKREKLFKKRKKIKKEKKYQKEKK